MGASGPMALIKNAPVFAIASFSCIGGVLYDYNQGMFNMGGYDPFVSNAHQTKKGWLTAILELGAWLGTLLSGLLAEPMSRKFGILVAVSVFVLGVVIQATAITNSGPNSILAGSFITGMGVGSMAMIVPVYNSEIAPALVLFSGMLFMQFSPHWLIHHSREAEARTVLARLRGLPADHELVKLEFLETKAQICGYQESVSTKPMFKGVVVATVTMFFQQWTGINAVLYYAPTIFSELGLSSTETSLLATGVVGIVMFVATNPAVLWFDRVGRKPVLTVGAIGMATCHIIIAVIKFRDRKHWDTQAAAGWAAVAMV
ncbi:putative quinate permease [Cytospora mali]|uniref:Quinate permease n=1 Tax=Cytospora mali TaxID=578113 RepID=A0A194UVW6_CYTMA|nr:putative quinate permease [Valsa mali var. pyri (nom. inval.)]